MGHRRRLHVVFFYACERFIFLIDYEPDKREGNYLRASVLLKIALFGSKRKLRTVCEIFSPGEALRRLKKCA